MPKAHLIIEARVASKQGLRVHKDICQASNDASLAILQGWKSCQEALAEQNCSVSARVRGLPSMQEQIVDCTLGVAATKDQNKSGTCA